MFEEGKDYVVSFDGETEFTFTYTGVEHGWHAGEVDGKKAIVNPVNVAYIQEA